jgi:hypothetical protein
MSNRPARISQAEIERAIRAAKQAGASEVVVRVEWLNRNPAPSPKCRCASCGEHESTSALVLSFGTEPGTHTWLHGECWLPWQKARGVEAVKALTRVGGLAGAALSERS